ncbi:hypothetical protein CEXT_485651 [Caerostris extrusa]|uniref:Uncharacterized protein n=1 Tax=Caerostris extrusa TaxID=172846 RepID=A0AAV4VXZ8_CAEEX|nr:hypothetical protein CEXT_485651 [Caerostris extrusa]
MHSPSMQVGLSLDLTCFYFPAFGRWKNRIFLDTQMRVGKKKGIAGNIRFSSLHLNVRGGERERRERKVEIPDQELSERCCIATEIACPSIKTSTE